MRDVKALHMHYLLSLMHMPYIVNYGYLGFLAISHILADTLISGLVDIPSEVKKICIVSVVNASE